MLSLSASLNIREWYLPKTSYLCNKAYFTRFVGQNILLIEALLYLKELGDNITVIHNYIV